MGKLGRDEGCLCCERPIGRRLWGEERELAGRREECLQLGQQNGILRVLARQGEIQSLRCAQSLAGGGDCGAGRGGGRERKGDILPRNR